ncbi:hypothetical protein [Streptomyces sp. E-15]
MTKDDTLVVMGVDLAALPAHCPNPADPARFNAGLRAFLGQLP